MNKPIICQVTRTSAWGNPASPHPDTVRTVIAGWGPSPRTTTIHTISFDTADAMLNWIAGLEDGEVVLSRPSVPKDAPVGLPEWEIEIYDDYRE
jgi:hypothetical protein